METMQNLHGHFDDPWGPVGNDRDGQGQQMTAVSKDSSYLLDY